MSVSALGKRIGGLQAGGKWVERRGDGGVTHRRTMRYHRGGGGVWLEVQRGVIAGSSVAG